MKKRISGKVRVDIKNGVLTKLGHIIKESVSQAEFRLNLREKNNNLKKKTS